MNANLLYEKLLLLLDCKWAEFVAAVLRKYHCPVLDYIESMVSCPELIMSDVLGNRVDDEDWDYVESKWFNFLGI